MGICMNNTGVTILSILMPSTPDRRKMFKKLYDKLSKQGLYLSDVHPMLGLAEIIIDDSPRFLDGGLSIGKKRESLVKKAEGKYSLFLDSDEDISPNYLETLMRLCYQDKDVCTFRNFTKMDDYWMLVDMGLGNDNEQATPDRMIKRSPWHICPVRSEFTKLYEFEDTNYGEDWSWFEKVLTHCKTEAHTDAILHSYQHSRNLSEADKIIKAGYV